MNSAKNQTIDVADKIHALDALVKRELVPQNIAKKWLGQGPMASFFTMVDTL